MRKNWYYKLLFSYMPVFFLLVSFLVFIFFQILTERAQRDTAQIYASINNQMAQTVEQTLRSIDHLMVTVQTRKNAASDFNILSFFDQEGQPSAFFTYQAISELSDMKQLNPLIHSVYLVRERDRYVLSMNTVAPIDRFADRAFVEPLLRDNYSYHWTNAREFREFVSSRPESVVSLARKYVAGSGESGLMIVNVQTAALLKLVSQSIDPSSSYLLVSGEDGASILPVNDQSAKRTKMAQTVSDYTGWTYESGITEDKGFSLLRSFSGAWMTVALAGIALGFAAIIYMTNRNYKPLRQLIASLDRIRATDIADDTAGSRQNEFHYIESTFSSLVERFKLFRTQTDLNSGYRAKTIFLEVMTGSRSLASEEWRAEIELHGLSGDFRQAIVLALSIDKYTEMLARFSEQDMLLYRFVIQNVYVELLQKSGLRSWSEWTNDREMCGFVYLEEHRSGELTELSKQLAEQLLQWIREHLPFTVTIGVGQPVESVPSLKESYNSALQAIHSRAVFGNDRMIGYWETGDRSSIELYDNLEQIRRLLYAFRMTDPDWRSRYAELFQQFRASKLKRDDIINLLNYFAYHLFEQIRGAVLHDDMLETNKAIMNDAIERFETLEDVQEDLLDVLDKLEYMIAERAGRGAASAIALQMKQYIDEHLSNPDLSLVHLSEQFNIPSKNVSALFKDQLDIKFIDFLIHRRVELAKQLLEETDCSVQEVGHKVGYLSPVSFNRVFKRVVGVPPGDYRKEKQG